MSNILSKLSGETQHKLFTDKMIIEIGFLAENCFNAQNDPEVSWKEFREQLKYWKVEHKISYLKYLESDAD